MPKASSLVLATDREVQKAAPKGERAEFRIKGAKNLILRVSASGAKSWHFLYAAPGSGLRRKLSLGTYPSKGLAAARDEALALAVAVRAGKDPLLQRGAEQAADTFDALARRYLTEHEHKNARNGERSRSTSEAERLLNSDILPFLGRHKAEGVSKRLVMMVVEAAADRGSYVVADRILGLIRAIYNWGAATGRLEVNPTLGLKKRNTGKPRDRTLSDDEIRTLWHRLDDPSGVAAEIRDALKLQLLLGLRIGEALGATKSEIDLERKTWTIPAHRTKANREHRLPLDDASRSILRAAIERSGESPWLFPSPFDGRQMRPHSATHAMRRLRIGINIVDANTHDLRRTLATGLGNLGIADEVIERVLNHAPRTVAGRHYNHAKHFESMRRALDAWSNRVTSIIRTDPNATNVVAFPASHKA